jgi:hypothetical protein
VKYEEDRKDKSKKWARVEDIYPVDGLPSRRARPSDRTVAAVVHRSRPPPPPHPPNRLERHLRRPTLPPCPPHHPQEIPEGRPSGLGGVPHRQGVPRPSTPPAHEIAYPCFFDCAEPSDSRKRKLYVNAETGLYSCKVCVSEGNGVTLMRHFGDEPEAENAPPSAGALEVLEEPPRPVSGCSSTTTTPCCTCSVPAAGSTPETVIERRLGYAPKQWPLTKQLPEDKGFKRQDLIAAGILAEGEYGDYEYYQDRILIPYIENGRVVQLRGKDIFGRYYTPSGTRSTSTTPTPSRAPPRRSSSRASSTA